MSAPPQVAHDFMFFHSVSAYLFTDSVLEGESSFWALAHKPTFRSFPMRQYGTLWWVISTHLFVKSCTYYEERVYHMGPVPPILPRTGLVMCDQVSYEWQIEGSVSARLATGDWYWQALHSQGITGFVLICNLHGVVWSRQVLASKQWQYGTLFLHNKYSF